MVVALKFGLGDHVPVMPLLEVVGSVKDDPRQMADTWLKVGKVG